MSFGKLSVGAMLVMATALTPRLLLAQASPGPSPFENSVEFPPVPPHEFRALPAPHEHRLDAAPIAYERAPNGYTLADFEAMALAANPTLSQAAARVRAAEGKWVQAGLPPNPTIGYLGAEMGNEGASGQQGMFFGQQVVTGGKLWLSRQIVDREIAQARQAWNAQRQRVLTDVRTSFHAVLLAERREVLTEKLLGVSRDAAATAEKLVNAREVRGLDLIQARIEADKAGIAHEQSLNARRAAWRRLTAVVGRPELSPGPVVGRLDDVHDVLTWEEVLNRLLSQSPLVAAADAEAERARWAVRKANADRVPDVDLQLEFLHDNATGFDVTTVQVGLPIPLLDRNQGAIRQARAELTAARGGVDRVRLDLERQLAEVFEQYTTARAQSERYAATILPAADQSLSLVQSGYSAGEVAYLDLLTGQRTYFETNLTYLDALQMLWTSRLRIEGLLLDGSLSTP